MKIAVTGATGQLGRLVVDHLLARGADAEDVVAVVRDEAKAAPLAELGVQVRVAAYGDVPALTEALDGVDRLLLVSGSEVGQRVAQHASVLEAAQAAGVGFLAYTSATRADTSDLVLAPEHRETEALLRASDLRVAILRNNWYHENHGAAVQEAAATGRVTTSTGTGRVASASRSDYAEAAAVVLLGDGDPVVLELGGDTAWSPSEFAEAASVAVGGPVTANVVSREEHLEALAAAGLDEGTAGFVTALDANIAAGDLDVVTGDLSRLVGHPTQPLAEGLARLA